jgi:hypothetical protein
LGYNFYCIFGFKPLLEILHNNIYVFVLINKTRGFYV